MRPPVDLAGVRDSPFAGPKLPISHGDTGGMEGAWGEWSCPPFSHASCLPFLMAKGRVCRRCRC